MFTPTKDEYGRPVWTPADPIVRTADGVAIVHGMRAFTNNLDIGVIDLTGELTGRGANYEWHGPEARWVLWFDVVIDTNYKGEAVSERLLQSHDRTAARYDGRSAATTGSVFTVEVVAVDDPDALAHDAVQAKEEARVLRAARRKEAAGVAEATTTVADILAALRGRS